MAFCRETGPIALREPDSISGFVYEIAFDRAINSFDLNRRCFLAAILCIGSSS